MVSTRAHLYLVITAAVSGTLCPELFLLRFYLCISDRIFFPDIMSWHSLMSSFYQTFISGHTQREQVHMGPSNPLSPVNRAVSYG